MYYEVRVMDKKRKSVECGKILFGAFLFCAGLNWFIVPLNLYNGGIVGIAQIIRSLIGVDLGFDLTGVINFILNIPLLIIAYTQLGRSLFFKTFLSIGTQTVLLSLLPIPSTPIISDVAVSCLMGGVICGTGIGLTLEAGGSSGGLDIVGLYLTKKYKNISVGKITIVVNCFIFAACAILFELPTAIYSVAFSFVYSLAVDKTHLQNINTSVMIFTKNKGIYDFIVHDMHRGVTYWQGTGGYTETDTYVIYTVLSKYEVRTLRHRLAEKDPNAFVIVTEQDQILGNYEVRL